MPALSDIGQRFAALPGPVRGAFWMIMSAVCIVSFTTIGRDLKGEVPVALMVFFRSLFGLMFMLPWLRHAGTGALRTNRPWTHFARGCSGAAGLFLLFAAVAHLPVADVMTINFTRPLFTSIVAVMILGEIFHRHRWIALGVGFIGTLIVLRPGFADFNIGVLFAFGAALTGTVSATLIKSLTRTEHPDTISMYATFSMFVLTAIPAIVFWQTPSWDQLLLLVAIGGFATAFQRCNTRAYAAADATYVLPFEFSRLPIAAAVGFVIFSELPDLWTWIGGAVIFAAGFALSRRERGGSTRS